MTDGVTISRSVARLDNTSSLLPAESAAFVSMNFDIVWSRARAHFDEGLYREALALLNQAIQLEPEHPLANFLLALWTFVATIQAETARAIASGSLAISRKGATLGNRS